MGDPCQLLLGVVGFVCLMVPAALAMLVAWILAVILAGRSHHWIWLASLLVPLVIAVPLWVTGSPLAANGLDEAGSALGNELLAIGWLMVGLTILISLVYSLWPHPKRPATAPTTAPSVAPSVHTLKGPKMPPNGPPTAPPT